MGRLMLKCKTCGEWFYSGVDTSAENNRFMSMGHYCSKGHYGVYNTPDFIEEDKLSRPRSDYYTENPP